MRVLCLALYKKFPTESGRVGLVSNSSSMRNRQTGDSSENKRCCSFGGADSPEKVI